MINVLLLADRELGVSRHVEHTLKTGLEDWTH